MDDEVEMAEKAARLAEALARTRVAERKADVEIDSAERIAKAKVESAERIARAEVEAAEQKAKTEVAAAEQKAKAEVVAAELKAKAEAAAFVAECEARAALAREKMDRNKDVIWKEAMNALATKMYGSETSSTTTSRASEQSHFRRELIRVSTILLEDHS